MINSVSQTKQIACSLSHSLAVDDKGRVLGWGDASLGRLGDSVAFADGESSALLSPTLLLSAESQYVTDVQSKDKQLSGKQAHVPAVACAAGLQTSLILLANGHVVEWGAPPLRAPRILQTLSVVSISCGSHHSLLIDSKGQCWTWGSGKSGALGHGNFADCVSPTHLASVGDVKGIAGGGRHSLVLTQSGTVYAFGVGENGRLGKGTAAGSCVPEKVEGVHMANVVYVAAGEAHSLALTREGRVFTWGCGSSGRLGLGTSDDVMFPTQVLALSALGDSSRVVSASLGTFHSACVTGDGRLFTWGGGSGNKLGFEDQSNRMTPSEVHGSQRFVSVACGPMHTIVTTESGHVVTWGIASASGRLGRKARPQVNSPRAPTRDSDMYRLEGHLAFAKVGTSPPALQKVENSKVVASEVMTHAGSETVLSPRAHQGMEFPSPPVISTHPSALRVKLLSTGANHAMILLHCGRLLAWGDNTFGQLGVAGATDVVRLSAPREVLVAENTFRAATSSMASLNSSELIAHVSCGSYHTLCVTHSSNQVYSWGRGVDGVLGTSSLFPCFEPSLVVALNNLRDEAASSTTTEPSLVRIVMVEAGDCHSMAIGNGGQVYAWGSTDGGMLGLGQVKESCVLLPRMVKFPAPPSRAVSATMGGASQFTSTGVASSGSQVRAALLESYPLAGSTTRVVRVSCGVGHTLALTNLGYVYAFGNGWFGRLGLGSTNNALEPTLVESLESHFVTQISAGSFHSAAVTSDGQLFLWGRGDARLGLGKASHKLEPHRIMLGSAPSTTSTLVGLAHQPSLLARVEMCVAGEDSTIVMMSDYSVWSFGIGRFGKLGLPPIKYKENENAELPERISSQVLSLSSTSQSKHAQFCARSTFSMAISDHGDVYGWGKLPGGGSRLGAADESGMYGTAEDSGIFLEPRKLDLEKMTMALAVSLPGTKSSSMAPVPSPRAPRETQVLSEPASSSFSALDGYLKLYTSGSQLASNKSTGYSTKDVPLWLVQALLREERALEQSPEENVYLLASKLRAKEEASMITLKDLLGAENDVRNIDQSIQLIVHSTLRLMDIETGRADPHVAHSRSRGRQHQLIGKVGKAKGNAGAPASELNQNASMATAVPRLSYDTLARFPAYESIFPLLLVNPSYMYRMYLLWVVSPVATTPTVNGHWRDLYLGLVRDLYPLKDAHCERLFCRLAQRIWQREMRSFAAEGGGGSKAYVQAMYGELLVARLLELYALEPVVVKWITSVLTPHLTRIAVGRDNFPLDVDPLAVADSLSAGGAAARASSNATPREVYKRDAEVRRIVDRRVLALAEFCGPIFNDLLRAITSSLPLHLGKLLTMYYGDLCENLMPEARDQAASTVVGIMFKTMFLRVLEEPTRIGLDTAGCTPGALNSVAKYLSLIVSSEEAAAACFAQQEWFTAIQSTLPLMHEELTRCTRASLFGAGLRIPTTDDLDAEISMDVGIEWLRASNNALYVFPTRRSLEFLRYTFHKHLDFVTSVKRSLRGVSSPTSGDGDEQEEESEVGLRDLMLPKVATPAEVMDDGDRTELEFEDPLRHLVRHGLLASPESEFQADQFPTLEFNDDWGLSMSLDLSFLSIRDLEANFSHTEKPRLRDYLRCDPVTRTPVPAKLVPPTASRLPEIDLDALDPHGDVSRAALSSNWTLDNELTPSQPFIETLESLLLRLGDFPRTKLHLDDTPVDVHRQLLSAIEAHTRTDSPLDLDDHQPDFALAPLGRGHAGRRNNVPSHANSLLNSTKSSLPNNVVLKGLLRRLVDRIAARRAAVAYLNSTMSAATTFEYRIGDMKTDVDKRRVALERVLQTLCKRREPKSAEGGDEARRESGVASPEPLASEDQRVVYLIAHRLGAQYTLTHPTFVADLRQRHARHDRGASSLSAVALVAPGAGCLPCLPVRWRSRRERGADEAFEAVKMILRRQLTTPSATKAAKTLKLRGYLVESLRALKTQGVVLDNRRQQDPKSREERKLVEPYVSVVFAETSIGVFTVSSIFAGDLVLVSSTVSVAHLASLDRSLTLTWELKENTEPASGEASGLLITFHVRMLLMLLSEVSVSAFF